MTSRNTQTNSKTPSNVGVGVTDLATSYADWVTCLISSQREQVAVAANVMENMMRVFGSPAEQFTTAQDKSKKSENVLEQANQQILNMFSPSTYMLNSLASLEKIQKVGGNTSNNDSVETLSGEVIFQNELIDLIKYQPVGKVVYAEPIMIVPAWFMKHDILDLTKQNSLLKYLINQGFTIFLVSWKHSQASAQSLAMEDYRQLGIAASLDAITDNMGNVKIHGIGYFLGGTLLSIAAAAMANEGDDRFQTLSLFASQLDFSDTAKDLTTELDAQPLRQAFLNNDFAEGKYKVGQEVIKMADVNRPIFVVDTERDHLANGHSVYKIHQLSDTDITFVLSNGGHYDASDGEPFEPNRTYRMSFTKKGDKFVAPEKWLKSHKRKQGSWWPELSKWLKLHSD